MLLHFLLLLGTFSGVSEMVEIPKNSQWHKELCLKQGLRSGFPLVLGTSSAFEPVECNSCARALCKGICRADRDIW